MSYVPQKLVSLCDEDKDCISVESAYADPTMRLFFSGSDSGVFLDVKQIKNLRKVLKQWLLDNGHKAKEF